MRVNFARLVLSQSCSLFLRVVYNEQDWLKTNLAKFTRMLQGHSDLVTVSKLVLSELTPLVNAQQGVFYTQVKGGDEPSLELLASYASKPSKHLSKTLRIGEGLVGQCAYEKKPILLEDVPDDYIRVCSSSRNRSPRSCKASRRSSRKPTTVWSSRRRICKIRKDC